MTCTVFIMRHRRKKDIRRLEKIIQRYSDKVTVRRAQVVLASIRGNTVPEIGSVQACSRKYARQTIHAFNEDGFASLWHIYRGGRRPTFTERQREKIVELPLLPPRTREVPVNRWTLQLLCEQAVKDKIVESISHETVRQILREHGVRIRRTKTWKDSKDPDKDAKWRRIKRLYRRCPEGARVISFDPFGPIEIRPVAGRHLARDGKVQRLPATYRRTQGVRHLMAWLDVDQDQMWGTIARRKTWESVLEAFRLIRASYLRNERIYIILDNASSHKKEEVRQWARETNVVLVFTATNASWMNRIECHFDAVREHALRGGYPENHLILSLRIFNYLRWRNARKRKQRKDAKRRKKAA